MSNNDKRVANISIVIRDRHSAAKVNEILSGNGDVVRGRLGLPYPERGVSVIIILVDADNKKISAITGAMGNLPGVTLRSTMLI